MNRARAWARRVARTARLVLLRAEGPRGPRRGGVLAVALATILFWQMSFTRTEGVKLDDTYRVTAASGMHNDHTFLYYFWYAGLFPVASTLAVVPCDYKCASTQESGAPAELSPEAARKLIKSRPETFVMDVSWTWMAGDRGKIFLYWLDAWLKGAPWKPSVKPFHRLAFISSLGLLFSAFWWIRRPLLGGALVLLLGSNPLQLYEVHGNDNVFGWSITTAILLLATHVPLLTRRRVQPWLVFVWPVATAAVMATIRTFRSEPMPMIAALLGTYLQVGFLGEPSRAGTWGRRLGLAAAFLVTFVVGDRLWGRYFAAKHEEARTVLAQIGGHPLPASIRMYHHFWHPVWCGLGDFDTKYGYAWNDTTALAYARPILEKEFHQYVPASNFLSAPKTLDEYYDAAFKYKRLPYDVPNYSEVIRDKVIADIKRDPAWYLGILSKRAARILTETTPVRFSWAKGWLTIPGLTGALFVPVLLATLLLRARFFAKLLVFTLPTCTTAFVVFSGRGIAWYGIFHLVTVAILVAVLAAGGELASRVLQRGAAARSSRNTPSASG